MQEKKFYRQDPVASFLIAQLRLTPLRITLMISLVSTAYSIFDPPDSIVLWLWRALLNPSIAGYYLWASQSMSNLLLELEQKSSVDVTDNDWYLADRTYRNPFWKYFAMGFASFSGGLFLLLYPYYGESISWLALLKTFGRMVGVYMIVITIAILIVNAWLLEKILEPKDLQIEPLHPDGCSGLRPLSQYSLKTAYLVATFGMILGLVEYRLILDGISDEFWFVHLSIPIYIVLSLTAFFVPLLTAHSKMLNAKNALLNTISRQFQKDYQSLIQLTRESDPELLSQQMKKVKQLDEIHQRTNQFAVWPFDMQSLRQYVLSLTAPLIPLIIALLQKSAELWLKRSGIFT